LHNSTHTHTHTHVYTSELVTNEKVIAYEKKNWVCCVINVQCVVLRILRNETQKVHLTNIKVQILDGVVC